MQNIGNEVIALSEAERIREQDGSRYALLSTTTSR